MINFAHGDGDPCPLISPFFCFPIFIFIFIFLIFLLCLGMYNNVVPPPATTLAVCTLQSVWWTFPLPSFNLHLLGQQ